MSTFPALSVKKAPVKAPVQVKKRSARVDMTRLLIHFAFVLLSRCIRLAACAGAVCFVYRPERTYYAWV